MVDAVRLSEAQWKLLGELVSINRFRCVDSYPPAKKLVSLGYATWFFTRHGQYLMPTYAGRAALTQGRESKS